MRGRRKVAMGIVVIAAAAVMVIPAWAGGWAVVTLDALPQDLQAGVAFTVGFTVRQHGRTPVSDLQPPPSIEARNPATGEAVLSTAKSIGGPGHYSATVTLPAGGDWEWGIRAFGDYLQPMPMIRVAAAQSTVRALAGASPLLGWFAAMMAIAGILLAFRRKYALSAGLIALAVLTGSYAFLGGEPASPMAEAAPLAPAAVGEGPFVAKGCVVCHVNARVSESRSESLAVGPDLSAYRNDPGFLRVWLADPAAVRPLTEMPDLDLSEQEIEALIQFLNDAGG